jgi:hypothetical protein
VNQQRVSYESRIRELHRENEILRDQCRELPTVIQPPEIGQQIKVIKDTITSTIKQFYCLTAAS